MDHKDHPEAELLLCCARSPLAPGMAARIGFPAGQELDWTRLVELARANGVLPLLYRSLAATRPDAVPEAILKDLADHFRRSSVRSLLMTVELLKLLELLAAHGIHAVPFKGPALAAAAYGDVALRQFSDLDLLLPRRDLRRARSLVVSQGFRAYRFNLEHPDSGLTIELHTLPISDFGFRISDCNPQSEIRNPQSPHSVDLLGTPVPTLPPAHTLLALAAHGSKHCWDRLSWVCDLAQFISAQPQMDWPGVFEQARSTGRMRRLLWGLLLVRDLLGLALPPEAAASAAADLRLPGLVAQARSLIFWTRPAPFGNIEQWATQLRSMERLRDKLRFCLGLLLEGLRPNKTDRAVVPLPKPLHLLYYAIQPIRIVVTYLPRAVRHLLKGAS